MPTLRVLSVFLLVALIVSVLLVLRGGSSSVVNNSFSSWIQSAPNVSPTTFPFIELTIPYLRAGSYESSLGELDQISQNANYTSYLTNYQSDGLKINGQLTVPTGDVPDGGWPAIVFVHGYIPPALYKTLVNYSAYVDYLAKNGFVVFKIDLRGHADSEGLASGAYYSGDYVVDILNARAALAIADFVNPDKIGLWGHSMAGNVTFRSFAARQDIPALVIWAGAVYNYEDLRSFGLNDNSYRPPEGNTERARKRKELFGKYGEFDPNSEFWKQVVPTNYLSDVKGAIQIHHAINDNVVDIRYSRNLMSILDKTTISHELFEYSSGGHNLTGVSFNSAMQRTVEFFKAKL